jgi:hypothetical protein
LVPQRPEDCFIDTLCWVVPGARGCEDTLAYAVSFAVDGLTAPDEAAELLDGHRRKRRSLLIKSSEQAGDPHHALEITLGESFHRPPEDTQNFVFTQPAAADRVPCGGDRMKYRLILLATVAAALMASGVALADQPEIDPTYVDGQTVYMIGVHRLIDARDNQPELYAHAEELYLLSYPQSSLPQPGAGPITLPSGYQPQCNPCFHPGLNARFVYHDHVLPGAPGMGNNGTAGLMMGPWKIIVLQYDPLYAMSPTFRPVTSADAIDAAEAAGDFRRISSGPNPFEIDTGNVLICPVVSDHA